MFVFGCVYVQGFLSRCRDYSTLFNAAKVETIFSNIEEIYKFQRDFLRELESKVDRDRMDCSEIGSVFVINVSYVKNLLLTLFCPVVINRFLIISET